MYVAMFLTAPVVYRCQNIQNDNVLLSLYIRRKVRYPGINEYHDIFV